MSYVELTEKSLAVCEKFWNQKNRCQSCPIHTVCTERTAWSEEAFNRHRARINEAAEQVQL